MRPNLKGRPTFCLIDLEAIRWNFRQARKKIGAGIQIFSVVKANAYGHGAREVAATLEEEGSEGFGIATVEEGIELRKGGIHSPLLILGGIFPEQLDALLDNNLTPVVSEMEALCRLEQMVQSRKTSLDFHLKVDTGMGRIGFLASEMASWLPELTKLKGLKLIGVMSHFTQMENAAQDYTQKQLDLFRNVLQRIQSEGYHPPFVHTAKSAGVLTFPPSHFTMVRPGLMLYGIYPSLETVKEATLKPALSWKTKIIQLKKVPKGSSISYEQTFVTRRESLIATLPVGYADGYKRLLSNRGAVLVRGQRAPIAGLVTMDLTMVDVTGIGGVQQGDEVVLLGKQGEDTISAGEMAQWADSISYEILTSISTRVPRIYAG